MTSSVIAALAASAALLVGAAGVGKLAGPRPAAAMLAAAWPALQRRRRRLPVVIRLSGGLEVAVAVAVLGVGGRVASAALGVLYLGFVVVVLAALRTSGDTAASCGCFGRSDAPLGRAHLVLDVMALAVCVAAILRPPPPLGGLLDQAPLPALLLAIQLLLLAWLGYLSITVLPSLAAERRSLEASA